MWDDMFYQARLLVRVADYTSRSVQTHHIMACVATGCFVAAELACPQIERKRRNRPDVGHQVTEGACLSSCPQPAELCG